MQAEVRPSAVRRLSFSNGGGGNEPKELKTSSGGAKEQGKMLKKKKKQVSKTKKAGLVFPVSRVHNRLKEDRFATRVRFFSKVWTSFFTL